MTCQIVSLTKTIFYRNVESLSLFTAKGEVEILPGHCEAFFLLKKGPLRLNKGRPHQETLLIKEGVCHIKDNSITIIEEN